MIWNLWPFCGFLLIDNWKSVKKRNKNEHRNISIHVNCKPIYYIIFRFFLDNHYSYLVKVFFLPRIIIFYRKFMNLRWIGDDPLLHMFNFTKNIPLVSEIQNRRLGLFFMLMTLCLVLSWRKNFRTVCRLTTYFVRFMELNGPRRTTERFAFKHACNRLSFISPARFLAMKSSVRIMCL